jgi:hypothetical protein
MMRSIPRPLGIPWRLVGVAVYVGLNLGLIAYFQRLPGLPHADWELWNALADGRCTTRTRWLPSCGPRGGWIMRIVPVIGCGPGLPCRSGLAPAERLAAHRALVAVSLGLHGPARRR